MRARVCEAQEHRGGTQRVVCCLNDLNLSRDKKTDINVGIVRELHCFSLRGTHIARAAFTNVCSTN